MRAFRRSFPLMLGAALLASCAINPVTGERQLSLIGTQQEIQMGQEAAAQVKDQIGLVQNDALQAYVSSVGMPLAKGSERPDLPWEFHVVDDPSPNAFALPGGFIFVTRGLMDLMGSEAQLAAVLGHEIGHVTARHSVTQLSRAELAQLGLGVGMVLLPDLQNFSGLASTGLGLIFLKYSRDDERQADQLGFRYALAHGYDVRQMAVVFQSLERASELTGGSSLPNWMSSHPATPDRIQTVDQRVAALNQPLNNLKVGRDVYLNHLDGLVFGMDPREGYFKGSTFVHPDMRFQIQFPAGWQTQNTAQSVAAGSPNNDAAVQLTLAGDTTPEAAARAFAAQQGVQAGTPVSVDIHGLPAVGVPFDASSQNGQALRGIATFVRYDGRTFSLLGYSAASAFAGYNDVIHNWARSFQPVTDPALIDVKPQRLRIVKLPRAMTLGAFNTAYPSAVTMDQLALINQVDGKDTQLAAGTLVKRVVKE
ncbi:MAG: M48 family metalloprotease [Gemmatimonadota bacterium]|jgi:predicted Zn-dependent protease